jgi:hypothetical protein
MLCNQLDDFPKWPYVWDNKSVSANIDQLKENELWNMASDSYVTQYTCFTVWINVFLFLLIKAHDIWKVTIFYANPDFQWVVVWVVNTSVPRN